MHMSVTTYVKRLGPALYGIDGLAEREIRELPLGVEMKATFVRPRSVKQNRLYWAMLRLVVENLSEPVTKEALHAWLKMKLGVVDAIPLRSGAIDVVPASTAFDAMDQIEFNAFFEKATDLLCEHIIPGLGREDLQREARNMLGWPSEAAA